MGKLTFVSKALIVLVILGAAFAALYFGGFLKAEKPVRVGVVTWGGYAGGQYFNGGFGASTESRYYTEYGTKVEFVVIDDFTPSRDAWKSGDIDVLWTTADAFPTEAGNLAAFDPKIIFQADWSRGGDAIVVTRNINNVQDLRGKTIAVAFGTPSYSFLMWLLQSAGMTVNDVQIKEAASAIDAATMFKAGAVDAAVVWSPDDDDCVQKVPGARVLTSTKQATNIIADVFFAKSEYIKTHKKELVALVSGWMKGAAEINSNAAAKQKAAEILSVGLNQPQDFCLNAINNTRLATYGDNQNFFNLIGGFSGVKGEDLYTKTGAMYMQVGQITGSFPQWRSVVDVSILKEIKGLEGAMHAAEAQFTYAKPTAAIANAQPMATKPVSIVFATGSYTLDNNAKTIIDMQVVDPLKNIAGTYVRITGNTDNTGDYNRNKDLSLKRAEASIDYLVSLGFNRDRFIAKGNGQDNPVADNSTEAGRALNRRTDFELIKK